MNVALPSIQRSLDMPGRDLQFIVTAYGTMLGGFLLLGGRLAGTLGRRRLLRTGLVLFGLASLAAGLSQDQGMLIAARAVQGLGSALVAPAALSTLTTTFTEGAARNKALGVWGALADIASVCGVLLGGLVSVPGLRLMIHEFRLYTSTLHWLTGRWRHGVREGDIAVRYASGGAGLLLTFAYLSVIETVVLAFLIPWPLVREITLALDLWGVFFIFGLFASFVVRPHVIGADGSLRLRSGALVDIRIPAQDIAAVRAERRTARGKKGTVDDDGGVNLSVGGQTTVTVELARPVTFTRPLGKQARARVFRFYAADPATAVAALRARVPELQNVP